MEERMKNNIVLNKIQKVYGIKNLLKEYEKTKLSNN